MEKDIRQLEFYLNGKLYKTCPYSQWDKVSDNIKNILRKNKYAHSYSSEYTNRQVIVVSHKIFTGHYDRKGNKIYDGDKVKTPYGFESRVHKHWDDLDHYYVREYGLRNRTTDYDIEDWSQFEKVEDVIKTPKKFWNEQEMTDESIL